MESLQFQLDVFEGPLDLLLHLIRKHKLSIYDIEISLLLEQYLNYINEMQAQNLEVASSFLEMAARLVYIKTCSLLPKPEEEKKLKAELTGQLLELDAIKRVAGVLKEQCRYGERYVREPMKVALSKEYRIQHDVQELLDAYDQMVIKIKRRLPPPESAFSGIVKHRVVSVASRVVYVLRRLYHSGEVPYQEFFRGGDCSEQVATFLAMLELIKSKRIRMSDDNQTVYFDRSKKGRETP